MDKQKNKLILILTAVTLISGFGIKYIITTFFPQFMIAWYPVIPIFFFIMGIILILNIFKVKTMEEKKSVSFYMMLRVIKILLSLFFLLIYWLTHKYNMKSFALIFMSFYIVYMITETYIYYSAEKWIKNSKTDEESI